MTAIILFAGLAHAAQNYPASLSGAQAAVKTQEMSEVESIMKLIGNVNLKAADRKSADAVQTILDWKSKIYSGNPAGASELKAPPATRRDAY